MSKKKSIRTKVSLISIAIALISTIAGVVSIFSITHLNSDYKEMNATSLFRLSQSYKIQKSFDDIKENISLVVNFDKMNMLDLVEEKYKTYQDSVTEISKLIDEYKLNLNNDDTVTQENKSRLNKDADSTKNEILGEYAENARVLYNYAKKANNDAKKNGEAFKAIGEANTEIEAYISDMVKAAEDKRDAALSENDTFTTIVVIAIIAIVIIIAAFQFTSYEIVKKIINAIIVLEKRFVGIVEGDLTTEVVKYKTGDELQELSESSQNLIEHLNLIIKDIRFILKEMANGNFDVKSDATEAYVGDFSEILDSINNINGSLSTTLETISNASEQVYAGAEQVADGAESLSQGTTEQAASIQELAATINEVFTTVVKNKDVSDDARTKAELVLEEISKSNSDMNSMLDAMEEINKSSYEIEGIIKVIEDIAFQTNILSLNAAVEAARAGDEGRGFMVVAEEVRQLASKSAEASRDSAELIIASIKAVSKGKKIAKQTAEILSKTVGAVNETVSRMREIATSCEDEYIQVKQINEGADQIASVVQTNSATAQQSAAISQELSGQAEMLRNTIGKFNLKK